MKYLVTGGAGFIGSNIVETLLKKGHEVTVIDDFSYGFMNNLKSLSAKIIKDSITNLNTVQKASEDIDVVLHLASMASVPLSIENPVLCHEINMRGTLNVLAAARDKGVKKVIFSSSSAVYGETKELPIKESTPKSPISPYGLTKLHGEHYCRMFYELYGLKYCTLRYFNVFGPKQNPNSDYAAVIPLFIKKILNNDQPKIYGDGEQTRDFLYVQNVVDANISAAMSNKIGVFNIAGGKRTSINNLVKKINIITGKSIKPVHLPERTGDIKHSCADIYKAMQIDYEPLIGSEEGLRKTIDWYK